MPTPFWAMKRGSPHPVYPVFPGFFPFFTVFGPEKHLKNNKYG
jgi:hypothetical protein